MIHDDIGIWSEIKLEIIKEYAVAYSTILAKQTDPSFYHLYIDAFAGSGVNISRATGEFVLGSPLNALNVDPPFQEFHFIDIDNEKIESLREEVGDRQDVWVYDGDCNEILLNQIFPRIRWEEYRRGLCLLDPYKIDLNWEVVTFAAESKTIEIFLNFSTHFLNRALLGRKGLKDVSEQNVLKMNAFWGDDSWIEITYRKQQTLFGDQWQKVSNRELALAYRERLRSHAGFQFVPEPIPMRNSKGAVVYYLFFASHKPVAEKIVNDIFTKFRLRGF